MKRRGWLLRVVPLVVFALVVAGSVLAQDDAQNMPPAPLNQQQDQANQQQDDQAPQPQDNPPGRVARLDYMSGEVSLQPGGVNDWVAGEMNRPLTSSDRVWADKNSRAELSLGTASIRMNSETSLTLTAVTDNNLQLELDQGMLNLSVYRMMPGEVYQVNMPNASFTVSKPGDYRFDVIPDRDESMVTVHHGGGEVSGSNNQVTVHEGEQARFSAEGQLEGNVGPAPNRDAFDQWALERDKRIVNSQSARYTAPGTIGTEDLDTSGTWSETPDYGPVWRPQVDAGWAPYRYGHWAYIAPWGWTWVDDEPWGFAPFHYGRWVYYDDAWAWAPGPVYVGIRPIWAPALVGWYGGGGWGVGFGVGFGAVGWFPLGWGEPFYPWYGCGRGYFRNVNYYGTRFRGGFGRYEHNYWSGHFRDDHFRYQQRGFSAMSRTGFAGGQSVRGHMLNVNASQMRGGRVLGRPGVNPTHGSYLGANGGRRGAIPPNGAFNRGARVNSANRGFNGRNSGNATGMHTTPHQSGAPFNNGHGNSANFGNAHGGNSTTMAHAGHYNVPRPPANFHPQMNSGRGNNNAYGGNVNRGTSGYNNRSYNRGSNVYNGGRTYSAGPSGSSRGYSNGGNTNRAYNGGGYSNRTYNGGANRTYNGGGASSHVYNGGGYSGRSYGSNRSSAPRSYSGGGGTRGGGSSSHSSGGGHSSSSSGHSSSGSNSSSSGHSNRH